MTTIVWRDGAMAADSRAYSGSSWAFGRKTKIRCHKGILMGISTNQVGIIDTVLDWYCGGMIKGPQGLKDSLAMTPEIAFMLLAVGSDGIGGLMVGHGVMTEAKADYFAIGSGEEYALGALAQGATAYEAVLAASKFDRFTAEPIDVLNHAGEDAGPLRTAT